MTPRPTEAEIWWHRYCTAIEQAEAAKLELAWVLMEQQKNLGYIP